MIMNCQRPSSSKKISGTYFIIPKLNLKIFFSTLKTFNTSCFRSMTPRKMTLENWKINWLEIWYRVTGLCLFDSEICMTKSKMRIWWITKATIHCIDEDPRWCHSTAWTNRIRICLFKIMIKCQVSLILLSPTWMTSFSIVLKIQWMILTNHQFRRFRSRAKIFKESEFWAVL